MPYRYLHVSLLAIAAMLPGLGSAQSGTPNSLKSGASATGVAVTNTSGKTVYANLVLGQPPVTPPAGCSSLGTQIVSLTDARLAFTSSVAGKAVSFTPVTGVSDKGSYAMAAGETITYTPQTFACGSAQCSAAVTFNFFFTPSDDGFSNNNGCSNSVFPNATNLAEASINFGVNGSVGTSCANADDTDISAVNGVNAILKVATSGAGWPAATSTAQNGLLGSNANKPGVFGWAATNCSGSQANAGYPNPSAACAAPKKAPLAKGNPAGCKTPGGSSYAPIVAPDGTQYCDERSDAGTCNNQRDAYVTGGTIQITYVKQAY
ncbi:hypothetical protein [Tahibacter caeni]|uniref:hypothetical protein n=1 Tax=Tahibacter caeni TaxID=1453545 RepID=UPI0021477E22|nr:hypothetical protein [Tahibacter caeni]